MPLNLTFIHIVIVIIIIKRDEPFAFVALRTAGFR